MATFRKFRLILWKNWLIRKRQLILTFLEIILPTIFSIFLLYMRNNEDPDNSRRENHPNFTKYDPNEIGEPNSDWGSLFMYTPNTELSRSLLQNITDAFLNYNAVETIPVNSEEEMDNIVLDSKVDDDTMIRRQQTFGVSFVDLGNTLPKKLHCRIRVDRYYHPLWETDILTYPTTVSGPMPGHRLYNSGFLWLQTLIAKRFIELSAEKEVIEPYETQLSIQRFPYPPYYEDSPFSLIVQRRLPLFIVFSYIFVSPTLIKHIVQEKELGVKELMKLMGLPGWLQWCGWFVSAYIIMSISGVIIVILLSCDWFGMITVLPNTSPFLFLCIMLLYIASSICFCFFITTFFSKPTIATGVGVILWIMSYFIPYFVFNRKYSTMSLLEKIAVMILPNMTMTWSIRCIIAFESRNLSLGWTNLFDPTHPGDNLTMAIIMFMFIIDILLYSFLTWYLDNVLPSAFGVRKPWFFIFTMKYWRPRTSATGPVTVEVSRQSSIDFEKDPVLPSIVVIQNLTKKYGWRETGKPAVNNINLTMYEGQITALLGHNGAGKTTTMSMLTGMFPPTSGTAFINNFNIQTDIEQTRKDLGLCPQHNMLFNNLTVVEHFKFFGSLKIPSRAVLNNEVKILIDQLKLRFAQDKLIRKLSGGMKRKVNLGMALIGGPKVIMLDEPTSGMDPEARRAIWDLLQEYRVGRCLVLTTHFMEEADVLADRIAIMVNGQIVCCGSPIFLKNRYGAGYHLNISKARFCNVARIGDLLRERIKGSYMSTNTVNEVSFVLPTDQTSNFPDAFRQLEDNMRDLGINSFGISVTTMEEVFLKVGENLEAVGGEAAPASRSFAAPVAKNVKCALWCQQFWAMILKRWYYTRRRWMIVLLQILLPVLTVLLILELISYIATPTRQEPPLVIDISQYEPTTVLTTIPEKFDSWYTMSFPEDTKFISVADIKNHIEQIHENEYSTYLKNYVVGAEMYIYDDFLVATAWYNGEYLHSHCLSLNLLFNALLKYSTQSNEYALIVENKPFPMPNEMAENESWGLDYIQMTLLAGFIPIGFSFLSASFVVFPIHERASKSKHLQLMTGVNAVIFWGASFLWDFAIHIISSCIVLLVFAVKDSTGTFSGEDTIEILSLILFFCGWCSIPFTYLASLLTLHPATGCTCLTILNIMTGIFLPPFILTAVDAKRDYVIIGGAVLWICRFLPMFTTTVAFLKIIDVYVEKEECKKPGCNEILTYLQWTRPGLGQEIFMMAMTGIFYFILLVLIESFIHVVRYYINKLRSVRPRLRAGQDQPAKLDSDVIIEINRVTKILRERQFGRYALVVNDLTKRFGGFNAVDRLNFSMGNAECFGLLGINGAGKTTAFEMLTGNLVVTRGDAFAIGKSLTNNRHSYLTKIGYCPQFNALFDYLTGKEMLRLFAHLRGIPRSKIKGVIEACIINFDLQDHAHKTTRVYSGGNKRKLSAALAFIGDPPIVFLDEPTTGVDPVARRKIWDILINANSVGISVVLTSHSMEECEILCSRVGIMVAGQFRCIGGTQYLKTKFSQGFIILAKIKLLKEGVEEMMKRQQNFQKYVQIQFPSAVLKDFHQGIVQYQVVDPRTKWTYLFETMEKAKSRFHLEDYSISQATLEQVFLSFAKRKELA